MDGAQVTRLQEFPWVDEVVEQTTFTKSVPKPPWPTRLDLYRIPWLRGMMYNRWPQLILRIGTLVGFVFSLLAALLGTPVGSHNFAIIMVWIAWWTALKLGFIPFGGRSWCSICPVPLPGEWLQQGGILERGRRKWGLNLRWPKALRGSWLQSGGFLIIGLFSAVTLTDPHVTGWVLLAIFGLASVLGLIFEQRAFCSYLCPIGGLSGMYAKAAPVELRVVDRNTCLRHAEKSCYQACPWGIYPLTLKDSSACGLCLECLRVCPRDNLALNLRPYGSDLTDNQSSNRLDEAFLALIMLGSALVFSAVFIGPWGWLKSAAYSIGSSTWMVYSTATLAFTLLGLPGIYAGCVWLAKKISRNRRPIRRLIALQARSLIPLGLLSWITFTISFALPKLDLVLRVLNDPFGWGWHWLNVNGASQALILSRFSPYLQVGLVILGVLWSAHVTQKTSLNEVRGSRLPSWPVLGFTVLYSVSLLWILVG
jgi:NAD-dependent dihydropyrimidine dehydrogenase PreA subunit